MGLIAHRKTDAGLIKTIKKYFLDNGRSVLIDPQTAKRLNEKGTSLEDMDVDVVLVMGGDGTILWAVSELNPKIPILGINTGRVGHFSEVKVEDAQQAVKRLLEGAGITIDSRSRIVANGKFEALNEVCIFPDKNATLLDMRVLTDNEELARFRADGVIISTQTGSTAYSLSAGGPILHPDVRAHVITPVLPYMKQQAPIVVPDSAEITVEFLREKRPAHILCDGHIKDPVGGGRVVIKKSKNAVKFIRFTTDARHTHVKKATKFQQ
ncbi:MAG: hypothetical protein MSIBF_05640 [Candidatus Altiarchaeales archaeon IMC4]|nr:MAG: hypothetical protein MSIBF_05640 [Candidatus Altiarchaeales archaeon IMC4]